MRGDDESTKKGKKQCWIEKNKVESTLKEMIQVQVPPVYCT